MLRKTHPQLVRPSAQGLSDLLMGLAGASAGALSGLAMDGGGYPLVAVCAAVATLPLLLAGARTGPRTAG